MVLTGVRSHSQETIQSMRAAQCRVVAREEKNKILREDIHDLTLRTIAYKVVRVAGSVAPHAVTVAQLELCLRCMEPTLFNWCEGMVACVKDKLTRLKRGRSNTCRYGSLLVSLFF